MRSSTKALVVLGILSTVGIVLFSSSVTAMRFSSTDYIIDTAVLNNVGGYSSSTNYQLTSSGGEAAIGNGASGSYKLAAGYVAQVITPAITVKTQPSGLVAYYPLDENSGTVAHDASSNTNFGTTNNNQLWIAGKIGSALSFGDSPNQYTSVPNNAALPTGNAMTIEIWAKSSTATGSRAIVSQWDYTGGTNHSAGWALQLTPVASPSTGLRFFLANSTSDVGGNYVDTPAGSWSTGSWHHVVVSYDGTQSAANRLTIYIDGVSQSLTINGTINSTLTSPAANLIIGDFTGLSRYWEGGIDQVKIFNRALSAGEVAAEYAAQNAGVETGLTLQTVLPGVSNNTTFDVITLTSGSSYNLAINQDHNLQNGAYTIPGVSGTIASPSAWTEGTTKGLGFTLVSTNATAIPGAWGSGNSYAAIPGISTSFYTRTGQQASNKEVLGIRLRLDVATSQASGSYSNTMTVTGTANP